jgi:hypothetical protein
MRLLVLVLIGCSTILAIVSADEMRAPTHTPVHFQESVRLNPILGLPGTDLAAFDRSVARLEDALGKLAAAQATPDEARALEALVPADFLRSLGSTEDARQKFLASGSSEDLRAYLGALRTSVRDGRRDLARYRESFNDMVPSDARRLPSLGGMMTSGSMRESHSALDRHFKATGRAVARLTACARGEQRACDPVAPLHADAHTAEPPASEHEVYRLWESAGGGANWRRVALESSTCLSTLPGPYFISVLEEGGHIRSLRYGADIFLLPLSDAEGPAHQYQRDGFGMRYSPVNPFKFYVCPDVGTDRSRIRAILAVREFADAHPLIAAKERSALRADITYESAARAYVAAALAAATSSDEKAAVGDLAALFWGNGDLADFLDDMADNFERDLAIRASGAPFDVSAATLFATQSAFPTLFLASDDLPLRTFSPENQTLYFQSVKRYTDLRGTVSREEIRRDLAAFLTFELITE